jgi:putative chitinase
MTDWNAVIRATADSRGKRPDPAIVATIADHADDQFETWGFTTLRRQAALLAHVCVETANFTTLEENLNYSAERLHEVWPKRFPTVGAAAPYAHNPQALANKVYGGRLGNRPGTDDGWIFRGKGLLQATGRDKGVLLGKRLGVSPDVAAARLIHPDHALECACALFALLGALPAADSGDVVAQTRKINGGKNGLAERQAAYARAVRALSRDTAKARLEANEENADAGRPVTARDLRRAGSRTIAGADQVRSGLASLATAGAAATGVASQVSDIAGQVQGAAESVQSAAGALAWAQDHWRLLALAALLAVVAWGAWRIWRGVNLVTRARVDDARLGVNIGR